MASLAVRRIGLVAGGLTMGVLGIALGAWFYLEAARIDQVRTAIGDRLRMSREAVARVEFVEEGALRIHLREVAILGEAGDTILAAPRLVVTLDPASLEGEGPIEFFDVELFDPLARLIQSPDGEWNYLRAFGITAAGQPVEAEEGRPLLFRDVTVSDGRVSVSLPSEPRPEESGAISADLPFTTIGGEIYQVYNVDDVQAVLTRVLIGGENGWRADIASFTGLVEQPEIRIAQLEGWAEQSGEDGVLFEIGTFRFGESEISGAGLVTFTEESLLYDVELEVPRMRFADLGTLFPGLGDQGNASFFVGVESFGAERVALTLTELTFAALDSRVSGDLSVAVGGQLGPSLMSGNLELAPVNLADLEALGLANDLPVTGRVTGRISTADALEGFANVDLRASLLANDVLDIIPSVVAATGTVALGDPLDEMRLDGLSIVLDPLYPATFRTLAPEQSERLRGALTGTISLTGTVREPGIADGTVAYEVGNAAPTRITGLNGQVTRAPELGYRFGAVAQPLALASLTELFPGLPFRAAMVSGPMEISGDTTGLELSADLDGAAGGIGLDGSLRFGEPLSFDISGDLTAFAAGMILRPEIPAEGPLSGTFSLRGTTEEMAFEVDLSQEGGTFVLRGDILAGADPPRLDASGEVVDFRIGALAGDPQLFPDPMSGSVAVAGGGGDPYRFDVDLRGETGQLDLAGFFQPDSIPIYEARGSVAALDLSRLPTPVRLPPSSLTGSVDIRGRGVDLETLEGSFAFDATESALTGLPLDAALGRVEIRGGVMVIDTLHIELEESRLTATGSWGLQSPALDPLRYSLSSPDLSVFTRVLAPTDFVPPELSGSIQAEGTVGGSVENPIIETTLTGRDLRYAEYRAAGLDLSIDARRTELDGWQGELAMEGVDLFTPQTQLVQVLNLQATGTQGEFTFGFSARRDAQTDLAASGLLELEGAIPRGAALDAITLRLGDVEWAMAGPARVRFTEAEGLLVENLILQRSGPVPGLLAVNGSIPQTGQAELTVNATNVDLSDFRRFSEAAPALEGLMSLDAVISGPVSGPEVSITARLDQLRYEGVATEVISFDGVLAERVFTGFAEATAAGQRLFRADLSVPMTFSLAEMAPAFELLMTEPAAMTVVADSLPLDLIAALLPGVSDGVGVTRAQIEVGGTLDVPELDGWVRLEGGALTVDSLSVRYTDIAADVALQQNRIVINSMTARSGGTMVVGGSVDFPAGSSPRLAVTVGLDGFRVMDDPTLAQLTASAQLALSGPLSEPVLTGWVQVLNSEIVVPELAEQEPGLELAYLEFGQLGPIPDEVVPAGPAFLANLHIEGVELSLLESVWLQSNEMRVQITGDLVLYRTGESLRIFGALQAVRGTYALEISGIVREFDVIRGRVQFFGTGDINPSLDILAGYRVRGATIGSGGDLTVLVQLSGSMLSPRVQLGSDTPVPLPEGDLISYLLFGQPSFELGGVGRGLAEQLLVQEVVGNLIATGLQRPILRAGLCDWVRVRPGLTTDIRGLLGGGALTGAAIECGWELVPEIFLTAQTGLGILGGELNEGRVGLEWQIDQEWMWEASYGSVERSPLTRIFDSRLRTQLSTDIRRQWEYGRPTQRNLLELLPEDPNAPLDVPGLPTSPVLQSSVGVRSENTGVRTNEGPPTTSSGPS